MTSGMMADGKGHKEIPLLPLGEKDTQAWRGAAEPSRSWMRGCAPTGARARESVTKAEPIESQRLCAARVRRGPLTQLRLSSLRSLSLRNPLPRGEWGRTRWRREREDGQRTQLPLTEGAGATTHQGRRDHYRAVVRAGDLAQLSARVRAAGAGESRIQRGGSGQGHLDHGTAGAAGAGPDRGRPLELHGGLQRHQQTIADLSRVDHRLRHFVRLPARRVP